MKFTKQDQRAIKRLRACQKHWCWLRWFILGVGCYMLVACSPHPKRHYEPEGKFSFIPPAGWLETTSCISFVSEYTRFQSTNINTPGGFGIMTTGLSFTNFTSSYVDDHHDSNETILAITTLTTKYGQVFTKVKSLDNAVNDKTLKGSLQHQLTYYTSTETGSLLFMCIGESYDETFDRVIESFRWEK